MTPLELIDCAFGGLDDAEREQIEGAIAADPPRSAELERVTRRIELLLDDGELIEPAPDLARRTIDFVAKQRTAAPRRSILDFVPVAVPFRWADVAVAAAVFLAGLATLLPAVHRSRLQTDQAVCAFNLGRIGRGLATYASMHGAYPYPPRNSPIPYAGLFKVMLHDAKLIEPTLFDCPSNGKDRHGADLPDYGTLCQLQKRSPDRVHHYVCSDYAYHIGVRQPSGRPAPMTPHLSERIPILADQPDHDRKLNILEGNSPNHGGLGQNVLYTDGHVGWHPTRVLGPHDPDMFLNADNLPRPGLHAGDAVLAPGCVRIFDDED